jgi:hypothetical protein
MQPPVQPIGAKTCSPELSAELRALSSLLPEGMILGVSPTDGDCFFDSVCQGFCASGIPNITRGQDVRLAVKAFWDKKSQTEAADDFGALLCGDATINLPSCYAGLDALKKLQGFKSWVSQDAQYIASKVRKQVGKAGFHQEFPTYPYWGGILDCQVT